MSSMDTGNSAQNVGRNPAQNLAQKKAVLREQVRAARAGQLGTAGLSRDDASLAALCLDWIHRETDRVAHPCVAAYSPLSAEPGGAELLPSLVRAGVDVLLPIAVADGQLQWARYSPGASMKPGKFGIAEPTGQREDSTVLATCDAIVLPALAVDEHGMRLGQGAGYYDRALLHAGQKPRAALVYTEEFLPNVPYEPHDQPVHAVITPAGIHQIFSSP